MQYEASVQWSLLTQWWAEKQTFQIQSPKQRPPKEAVAFPENIHSPRQPTEWKKSQVQSRSSQKKWKSKDANSAQNCSWSIPQKPAILQASQEYDIWSLARSDLTQNQRGRVSRWESNPGGKFLRRNVQTPWERPHSILRRSSWSRKWPRGRENSERRWSRVALASHYGGNVCQIVIFFLQSGRNFCSLGPIYT